MAGLQASPDGLTWSCLRLRKAGSSDPAFVSFEPEAYLQRDLSVGHLAVDHVAASFPARRTSPTGCRKPCGPWRRAPSALLPSRRESP
eukprot:gene11395-15328_t